MIRKEVHERQMDTAQTLHPLVHIQLEFSSAPEFHYQYLALERVRSTHLSLSVAATSRKQSGRLVYSARAWVEGERSLSIRLSVEGSLEDHSEYQERGEFRFRNLDVADTGDSQTNRVDAPIHAIFL